MLDEGGVFHVFATGTDGSLLEFYKTPNAAWAVFNCSQDQGINDIKISGRPFAVLDGGGVFHVFAAGTDGSLLEFYKTPNAAWAVFNCSQDQGVNDTKISGLPFAVLDGGGNFHVFAMGNDAGAAGSFLEFYKTPNAAWAVFNHSQDQGINGIKISSPFAVLDGGGNFHVFGVGADGSFLEFYKTPNAPWAVFNHSQDQGINGIKMGGLPFALLDGGGNFHVFAQGAEGIGIEGSFLEFYKAPNAAWVVFNHSQDQGINGITISGLPFALLDAGGNFHMFSRE